MVKFYIKERTGDFENVSGKRSLMEKAGLTDSSHSILKSEMPQVVQT